MREKWRNHKENIIFDTVVTAALIIAGVLALYPLLYVLSASISDPSLVNSGQVVLWPKGIQFEGYKMVFQSKWILTGYRNSIIYTVAGTLVNVTVTFFAAYSLSRNNLFGKRWITLFLAIPMWFSGGLIPTFLVVKNLHLNDTPFVLIVLGAFSMYNCLICRTFIKSNIPEELVEAARIDGCMDFGIIFKIVIPLSKPVLAIIALFAALGFWNDYFNAMIYLNDRNLQTLQLFLREILIKQQSITTNVSGDISAMMQQAQMAQVMKYSLIVIASLPMLIIYPFLQKFFVKGIMIGSIKG